MSVPLEICFYSLHFPIWGRVMYGEWVSKWGSSCSLNSWGQDFSLSHHIWAGDSSETKRCSFFWRSLICELLGFLISVIKISVLLGCTVPSVGHWYLLFEDEMMVSSRVTDFLLTSWDCCIVWKCYAPVTQWYGITFQKNILLLLLDPWKVREHVSFLPCSDWLWVISTSVR